jgi:hypothetical protein
MSALADVGKWQILLQKSAMTKALRLVRNS